jgi:4-hydroxy-3-methylbut-2-en-1-yl diphosphate reductase
LPATESPPRKAGKRIFLLSEMIHNPEVNSDLRSRGVQFLMDTSGRTLIPLSELTSDDIVIVPAFGTTVQIQESLQRIGIDPYRYDTTCPFVKRVWRKAEELGEKGYTVVIHGKRSHEETAATFSHATQKTIGPVTDNSIADGTPCVIVRDLEDAAFLADLILGKISLPLFSERFAGATSEGFDPALHLERVGVVNQTTMLASETEAISLLIRDAMKTKYGVINLPQHFADTKDTLCYATNENQNATKAMIEAGADIAIVVGGYNSSNTTHLVELCSERLPTFYIKDASEILSKREICHFDLTSRSVVLTRDWLSQKDSSRPLKIALTSGASCPDRTVDQVVSRVLELFEDAKTSQEALKELVSSGNSRGEKALTQPKPSLLAVYI